ncbi:uncharacterized protein BO97DRAFT_429501 [Aspergillus homomorphus CBS 101889]|uniref:Carrier domain-containing protein n=1 Tax=Aspergillus homomorphus (strain CBS 101889) TaxID=1450537 RepID=A0A395HH11_ASPHC|nr:hypothetical protein BO97DRAFT_429501 [Aspergillus homomorphus CBS 101889]RAL07202.1 hypothetical protein BO97DRAFT_429501 [Aspergillus homomorphus CBS 101889]
MDLVPPLHVPYASSQLPIGGVIIGTGLDSNTTPPHITYVAVNNLLLGGPLVYDDTKLLVPVVKIDSTIPITKFGMDSMLAAEFRTWSYQTHKTDIPFLSILNEATTLKGLAEVVKGGLEDKV